MANCNECPIKTHKLEHSNWLSVSPGGDVMDYTNSMSRRYDDLKVNVLDICKEKIGSMACGYALGRVEQTVHDNAWNIAYPKDDSDRRVYSHGGNIDDDIYVDDIRQFRLEVEQGVVEC